MRQAGIIAAAGIYALDHHIERLKDDHQNARRLAVGLKEFKGVSMILNMWKRILLFSTCPILNDWSSGGRSHEEGRVLIHAFSRTQIRLVTHLDITSEDIETALKAFEKILRR